MRTATPWRQLSTLGAGLLLVAACSTGADPTDPIELGSSEPAVDDEDSTDAEDGGDGQSDDPSTPSSDDASTERSEATAADDADEQQPIDAPDAGLVDLTEAIPGTWPVGDAGTVTFAIVDGALELEDATAADGWQLDIDEQEPDEIEVDFRRGDVEWEIEIELEDGGTILEIEIDQDMERAAPGSYDIGDAGTFAFSVTDGRLVLDDLNVADGWTVAELEEEADEIEFELVQGPRAFDVEIELDSDGTIEIEIDYEVVGPVTG